MPTESEQVTKLLAQIPSRPEAANELLPLVYSQLRAIANQRMREERVGHTLQATALVHEAYVRLAAASDDGRQFEGRTHFFRVAADAMRKILIDHARRHRADKRGGGVKQRSLGAIEPSIDTDPELLLAMEEALTTLQSEDARAAEVVQLRFYGGLSFEEIAESLKVSERTVLREWAFARARLVLL